MPIDLNALARAGAEERLATLERERQALLKMFPDLRAKARAGSSLGRRRRRRPEMTDDQKKAVSERMKKYWAARRALAKK